MQVRVIYFAAVRDLVERSEESIELDESVRTVSDLSRVLLEKYPRLHLEGVRVAVNEEFVEASHPLGDSDVVALIPPVSGG